MPRVFASSGSSTGNGGALIVKDTSIPDEQLHLYYTQGRDKNVKVHPPSNQPTLRSAPSRSPGGLLVALCSDGAEPASLRVRAARIVSTISVTAKSASTAATSAHLTFG